MCAEIPVQRLCICMGMKRDWKELFVSNSMLLYAYHWLETVDCFCTYLDGPAEPA